MTELKTLKDIMYKNGINIISVGYEFEAQLKQEAIKWVKELDDMPFDYEDDEKNGEIIGKIEWIKLFFNLTEEDLK